MMRLRSVFVKGRCMNLPDPTDPEIPLPAEIWGLIFKFLDPKSWLGMRGVSKIWDAELCRLITLNNKQSTPAESSIKWEGNNKKMLRIKEIIEKASAPAIFSTCKISTTLNLERTQKYLLPKFGNLIRMMKLTLGGFKFQKEQSLEIVNMVWDVLAKQCKNVTVLKLDLPKKIRNKYDLEPTEFIKNFHQTAVVLMKQMSGTEITNLKTFIVGGNVIRFCPELVLLILVFANNLINVLFKPSYYPKSKDYTFKARIGSAVTGLIFSKAILYLNKQVDKPAVVLNVTSLSYQMPLYFHSLCVIEKKLKQKHPEWFAE